jgi:ABC-type multidrug transport system permease subunit
MYTTYIYNTIIMKKALLYTATLSTTSVAAFAQAAPSIPASNAGQSLLNLFTLIQTIVNMVTPYIIGAIALTSLYFAFVYFVSGRKEESKRASACKILGKLAVLTCAVVAVWGAVGVFTAMVTPK